MTLLEELETLLLAPTLTYAKAPAITNFLVALRAKLRDGSPEDACLKTVDEVREKVKRGRGRGIECPVCDQYAKIYKRPLSKNMTKCLLELIRVYVKRRDWIECRQFKWSGGDYAKLAYWGFIEFEKPKVSRRRQSGGVKPTQKGIQFALAQTVVPSHALVYNKNFLGFANAKTVRIADVPGFDPESILDYVRGAENLSW